MSRNILRQVNKDDWPEIPRQDYDWRSRLVRDGEAFVMDHDQSFAARKLIAAIMQIIEEDYNRGKSINSTKGEKAAGGD